MLNVKIFRILDGMLLSKYLALMNSIISILEVYGQNAIYIFLKNSLLSCSTFSLSSVASQSLSLSPLLLSHSHGRLTLSSRRRSHPYPASADLAPSQPPPISSAAVTRPRVHLNWRVWFLNAHPLNQPITYGEGFLFLVINNLVHLCIYILKNCYI